MSTNMPERVPRRTQTDERSPAGTRERSENRGLGRDTELGTDATATGSPHPPHTPARLTHGHTGTGRAETEAETDPQGARIGRSAAPGSIGAPNPTSAGGPHEGGPSAAVPDPYARVLGNVLVMGFGDLVEVLSEIRDQQAEVVKILRKLDLERVATVHAPRKWQKAEAEPEFDPSTHVPAGRPMRTENSLRGIRCPVCKKPIAVGEYVYKSRDTRTGKPVSFNPPCFKRFYDVSTGRQLTYNGGGEAA